MNRFEIIDEYKDKNIKLPEQDKNSAFYNIEAAEHVIIPSLFNNMRELNGFIPMPNLGHNIGQSVSYFSQMEKTNELYTIKGISDVVNKLNAVTMIPTGLKVNLDTGTLLGIYPNNVGINCLLMIATQTQIIDSRHKDQILIPMINLSPYDIEIKKGDIIVQGIVQVYVSDVDNSITNCTVYNNYDESIKTEYVNPIEYQHPDFTTAKYIPEPNVIITAHNGQGDE